MIRISFVFFVAVFLLEGHGITLNNGGYEDIYIAIQDTVPENLELLNKIKDVFTKSSKFLFNATRNKTYFKSIKVLIPKTWSKQPFYISIPAFSGLTTYIKVDKRPKLLDPHVKRRSNKCGDEGLYMFLSPQFLLANGRTNCGKQENVVVHEWGHLRWGLFDEYPTTKDSQFYPEHGEWKPTICSTKVTGSIGRGQRCAPYHKCDTKNTKTKIGKFCRFCPDDNQDTKVSLMGYQYVDALTMFCDKNDLSIPENQRHNDKAPNLQNQFCKVSAWEVMREHPDFKSDPKALPSSFDTVPEFTFITETNMYRVFVLDISGSMDSNNRIGILHQSGEYIINDVIPLGSWLGIVWFSTTASRKGNITQVNSESDREYLRQLLPTFTDSDTCIGCGIEEAIQMLTEELGSAENGEIILITDGENTDGDLSAAVAAAVQAKVVIHTVAVSDDAEAILSDIASETGGKYFTYLETETVSFASVFAATIIDGGITSEASRPVTLMSETRSPSSSVFNVEFSLEEGLGKNTSFTLLVNNHDHIDIHLKGPHNYTQTLARKGSSASLKIPGHAKAGRYIVEIRLQSTQTIEYFVKSFPSSSDGNVVRVSSRLASSKVDMSFDTLPVVLVDVTKSNAPVLNATVQAMVDSGKQCTVKLHDNGIDPDLLQNDGTYTGYILRDCLNSGRVNIKVYANGNPGETLIGYGLAGGAYSPYADESDTEVNDDEFQRVEVTEELFITNYVPSTEDVTGPGRITDVALKSIQTEVTEFGENRNFTITWTAPGDDRNIGQASKYEMKVSRNYYTLMNKFDTAETLGMINASIAPQTAGETEALKIIVDAKEVFTENMYFAVRAVDENGNTGPVSNIVSIVVASGYRISGDQGNAIDETIEPVENTKENIPRKLYLISVVVVIVILVSVCLMVVCFKNCRRKSKGRRDDRLPTTVGSNEEESCPTDALVGTIPEISIDVKESVSIQRVEYRRVVQKTGNRYRK